MSFQVLQAGTGAWFYRATSPEPDGFDSDTFYEHYARFAAEQERVSGWEHVLAIVLIGEEVSRSALLADVGRTTLARQLYGLTHGWTRYGVRIGGNRLVYVYGRELGSVVTPQLVRDALVLESIRGRTTTYWPGDQDVSIEISGVNRDIGPVVGVLDPYVREQLYPRGATFQIGNACVLARLHDGQLLVTRTLVATGLPALPEWQAIWQAFMLNDRALWCDCPAVMLRAGSGTITSSSSWVLSALRQLYLAQQPNVSMSQIIYRTHHVQRPVHRRSGMPEWVSYVDGTQEYLERDIPHSFPIVHVRAQYLREVGVQTMIHAAVDARAAQVMWAMERQRPTTHITPPWVTQGPPRVGTATRNWTVLPDPDTPPSRRPPRVECDVPDIELTPCVPLTLSPARFGIELEFDPHNGSQEWYYDALRAALNPLDTRPVRNEGYMHSNGNSWDLKTDSSCGLELATPALTWDNFHLVEVAVKALRDAGARITPACGVHIHHECARMRVTAVRRLMLMWYTYEDVLFSMVNPERKSNYYCAPMRGQMSFEHLRTGLGQARLIRTTSSILGKYRSLNTLPWWNSGRVEVRMHHGTLQPNTIRLWTAITQQMITKSREVSNYNTLRNISEMPLPGQFRRFVRTYCPPESLLAQVTKLTHRYNPELVA